MGERMLEERRLRGDGIVTYVVSKTLGDVARERARAIVASTLLLLLGWHVVDLRRILLSSTLCLAALVAHLVTQTQLSESITLIKQLGVQTSRPSSNFLIQAYKESKNCI